MSADENKLFDYHFFQDKRILITGGLGFIGSSIAHWCVQLGAHVTLLDACLEPYGWNFANIENINHDVTFVKGDIRDQKTIDPLVRDSEIIFHMAAQVGREISMEKPEMDIQVNCIGTIHILESLRKMSKPAKIIFAGSRGQAGEPLTIPVDETHPDNPTDIYGINKLSAEKYILLYHKVYGIPAVSLRLNNVYGPRCQMHAGFYGILNWFMANAMLDRPITIYGKGNQTRDYVFIDDVVDAFIRAAILPKSSGEIYYVGSGVETIFIDMVREIIRAVGKGEIIHVPFPEAREKIDIKRFVVSTKKLCQATGWEPKIDLRTGVEKTVLFYEKRLEKYLRDKS
jgi:UDP-glucose 4-epimerase